MSDIFSNKYFLGATAIITAGVIYYGYQTTNVAGTTTATADVIATPSTTTVSSDGTGTTATSEGTTSNTNATDTTTAGN